VVRSIELELTNCLAALAECAIEVNASVNLPRLGVAWLAPLQRRLKVHAFEAQR